MPIVQADQINYSALTLGDSYCQQWPQRPAPPFGTSWNPVDKDAGVTLSNANRDAQGGSVRGIASAASGKRYYEVKIITVTAPNFPYIGICDTVTLPSTVGSAVNSYAYYNNGGSGITFANSALDFSGSVPIYDVNDVIGVAVDIDAGKIWYSKNGVWINNPSGSAGNPSAGINHRASIATGRTYYPAITTGTWVLRGNFAISDFAYPAPAGFSKW